jgi:hypothetical protein
MAEVKDCASSEDMPFGTWFLFSEKGVSKLAFSAVFDPHGNQRTAHCIVVSPGPPSSRPRRTVSSFGAFPIDGAFVVTPPNVTTFRSGYDGGFEAGSLIVVPGRKLLAFTFPNSGHIGLVDIESGRHVESSLKPPFGWFSEWRLFQKGPNRPEEIFRFIGPQSNAAAHVTAA